MYICYYLIKKKVELVDYGLFWLTALSKIGNPRKAGLLIFTSSTLSPLVPSGDPG